VDPRYHHLAEEMVKKRNRDYQAGKELLKSLVCGEDRVKLGAQLDKYVR
jgi:hypothetical protein